MSGKTCTTCGAVIHEDEKNCPQCGTALIATSVPTISTPDEAGTAAHNISSSKASTPAISRVLANWKTSVGASIGGFFAFLALGRSIELVSSTSYGGFLLYLIASFIWITCSICYASSFYPSLFRADSQYSASSAFISFMNLFFGGIIFGCLWNSNLTKGAKGISYIVYVIIGVIELVIGFVVTASVLL
ncbi:hypothetical protein [Adlercreutzia sp. ZJ141]|uniref:hypothetical protein n=1 Tax=Adlercreutzia sp. ZJ141 TaxID=2709406 RepID=UPI0013EAFB01|nr:hypothetical protein [Adlercreutzia sp. ZJ141]